MRHKCHRTTLSYYRLPQQRVMSELGSIVEGDGLAQLRRNAAEDAHDNGGRFSGVLACEAGGQGEAAFAPREGQGRAGCA